MLIERNSSDTAMSSHVIIDVPRIKGSITSSIERKIIERIQNLLVEWAVIRDICLVEGLSMFSENDISVFWNSCSSYA